MNMWTSFKSFFRRDLQVKNDPTYQVAMQFYSPGQPIWSDRNYASFVKEGYKKCGSVYACINKIAGAAASIKWKLYTDASMEREIPSHPLLNLWKRPNPRMGTAELIEQLFGFWHMDGNCYLWSNRPNPKQPPVELWPLHPNMIKVVAGRMDIQGYVYGWGTPGVQNFDPDELMHLKFTSYDDKPHYGLSPLEVAMRTIDQMNAGNDWNTALMQNDARPGGLFTSKGYLTVEQRAQINKELKRRYSGKGNAGKPLVLEADMGYQNMAIPPKELDWLNSRGFNSREIATILDVPPILVGDQTGQTYANLKEAKQSLFTENVLPKMYRIVDHLNIWLIPMYDDLARSGAYLSYDKRDIEVLAELYTSVEQAFAERALNLWNNGGCSLRYLQEVQGMEPKKSVYLDVYKFGAIIVREEDLEEYAMQALQKPAVPEPLINPPTPGQPALPAPGTTTVTEVPNQEPKHGKVGHKVIDLTTKEDKDAYAAQVEADRTRWEKIITKRVEIYFEDEHKAIAKALEGCSIEQQAENAIEKMLAAQQDDMQQLIYDIWHDVGDDFGTQTAEQLAATSKSYPHHYQMKGILSIFTTKIISWLLNLAATKAKEITENTRQQLRQALADGVALGESIPKIANRIDALYLEQIIPNRSTIIARTEVVSSSNWASMAAAESSGLTLKKVWLATGDNRTRPAHADADGQEVDFQEPFEVGGEKLMYPGDPAGSAENIIQCRCTQFFRRVKATETSKIQIVRGREFKSVREFMEGVLV